MTLKEFKERWDFIPHRQGPTKILELRFRAKPLDQFRHQVFCTIWHQTLSRFGAMGEGDTYEEALENLDVQLRYNLAYVQELAVSNTGSPERPIGIVLLGAGFSVPFGFPDVVKLKNISLKLCTAPQHPDSCQFSHAVSEYPLTDFSAGAFQNIEQFLTVWLGYLEQLAFLDSVDDS